VARVEFVGTLPLRIVSGVIYTVEGDNWNPSTDWAQGGPIIEREGIAVDCERSSGRVSGWVACNEVAGDENWDANVHYGPTPLVAAMRCYVASKLGDEVEIPEELK
jgi:hypothetical protein